MDYFEEDLIESHDLIYFHLIMKNKIEALVTDKLAVPFFQQYQSI